jgi:hypothetical protein
VDLFPDVLIFGDRIRSPGRTPDLSRISSSLLNLEFLLISDAFTPNNGRLVSRISV